MYIQIAHFGNSNEFCVDVTCCIYITFVLIDQLFAGNYIYKVLSAETCKNYTMVLSEKILFAMHYLIFEHLLYLTF